MDYTWSQQIAGRRAVYVSDAVALAADPEDLTYLRKQVWRWMAGFCQNVRLHLGRLIVHKPLLALWVLLALLEILTAPLWWATPFLLTATTDQPPALAFAWWAGAELLLTTPPLLYAARRRKLPLAGVLLNIPCVYATKAVNLVYAWKALIVELLLVPLHLARGLTVYEKGRPAIPASGDAVTQRRPGHVMGRLTPGRRTVAGGDADVVDDELLREGGAAVRVARPVAADREVEDQEERLVEHPLLAAEVGRGARLVDVAVHGPGDRVRATSRRRRCGSRRRTPGRRAGCSRRRCRPSRSSRARAGCRGRWTVRSRRSP